MSLAMICGCSLLGGDFLPYSKKPLCHVFIVTLTTKSTLENNGADNFTVVDLLWAKRLTDFYRSRWLVTKRTFYDNRLPIFDIRAMIHGSLVIQNVGVRKRTWGEFSRTSNGEISPLILLTVAAAVLLANHIQIFCCKGSLNCVNNQFSAY